MKKLYQLCQFFRLLHPGVASRQLMQLIHAECELSYGWNTIQLYFFAGTASF